MGSELGSGGVGIGSGGARNQSSRAGLLSWTEAVEKSEEDRRSYRLLHLANDMRVLLVSDPETDKSGAGLGVGVGHLSDPWELPGLAHFCEHMLFLGTKAFPEENAYHKFLSEHGGGANAYTAADATVYFFDVAPEALSGALDRFAAFFISPLFNEDCVDREVNAVDSEDKNYQKNDSWRLVQMERSHSNPRHDYAKFGTGNRRTLWDEPKKVGKDPRTELLDFHKKHYSAGVMSLCLVGRESLAELEEMVLSRFGAVENNGRERYHWTEHPWGEEQLGQRLDVIPVKELRSLHIAWPLPDQHPHWRSQPAGYVAHLLGHEGPGSLLSELKRRGWVSSLSAGPREAASGFAFFSLDVDLSEEGLEHVDDILRLSFAYLGLIAKNGVQEWIHRECETLNGIRFRFKDKENPQNLAMSQAASLHRYPSEQSLRGPYIMDEWKPELVKDVLDRLNPQNFSAIVIAKGDENAKGVEREKWYGTAFKRSSFSRAFLEECEKMRQEAGAGEFSLPSQNLFLPDDFSLRCKDVAESAEEEFGPSLIVDTLQSRLWHKLDREYCLPKAESYFHLSSPLAYATPMDSVLTHMFVLCASDALTELTYDAALAGLHYSLENGRYGICLKVSGYNQKQGHLLSELTKRIAALEIDERRFSVLREAYLRQLKSWPLEQPYKQAMTYSNQCLAQRAHTNEEKLAAAEKGLSIQALRDFVPRLLASVHIEGLCHGNLRKAEAEELLERVWRGLEEGGKTPTRLAPELMERDREVALNDGSSCFYQRPNTSQPNSALELILQTGVQERRGNVLLELVGQLLSEPAFDQLRTKESLGYIVFSGTRRAHGAQGLRFLVQGEKDPREVEQRVEAFLAAQRLRLADLSSEEFTTAVEALASQRLEKPKKLKQRARIFWSEIQSQQFDFQREVAEVELLRKLSKEDLLKYWDAHIAKGAPLRRKLVTQVYSSAVEKARASEAKKEEKEEEKKEEIGDVGEWRRFQSLHALPRPARPIPRLGCPQQPSK